MKVQQALEKLFSLHQFGIKLGLENIQNLLEYLGNPQNKLAAFHIAGSNGKGSTAGFIASILMEAGYKTALYTSPHYVLFNERIRINRELISDEYISDFMNSLVKYIDKNSPTFFELTTAMAFKYFEENKTDYAVIETGLGGRLDATNVLNPLASVITTISLEHTNILGNDIKKIAFEKAGIIKSGTHVFAGVMPAAAEKVLENVSSERSALFLPVRKFITAFNNSLILHDGKFIYNIYQTPLKGKHQLINSALAVHSLYKTLAISDWLLINNGISKVVENSGMQGRYEVINEDPKIIIDSAHNPQGVEAFIQQFKAEYMRYDKREIVFGCMKDKNYLLMLKMLSKYFDKFYLTSIKNERAESSENLLAAAHKINLNASGLADAAEFVVNYRKKKSNNCLVILGSIYILGEVKLKLLHNFA